MTYCSSFLLFTSVYLLPSVPLPPRRPHPDQLRNAVFAVVAQRAIRRVARDVFEHLHDLDMSYHLAKNTGAVSRIIDRGGESHRLVSGGPNQVATHPRRCVRCCTCC